MQPDSSIGRLLACLAIVVVVGGALAGVVTGTATAGNGSDLTTAMTDERLSDSIDDGLNETTDTVEGTTDTVENTTEETSDGVEQTSDETTDSVENTTDETTDAIEDTTDDAGTDGTASEPAAAVDSATANELENTTTTIDDTVTVTSGFVQYTVDVTTGAVEYTVLGPTALVDATVSELLTIDLDLGTLDVESSASIETRADDGATSEASGSDSDEADDSDDRAGSSGSAPDTRSSAADALLVGLLGVMAAPGVATGGSGAGVGAGAASGSTAATSTLRHLRHAGSIVPWDVLPIFRYSRYDDSDPLENDRRRAVYETIVDDPGCYLSQISDRSGVSLSTVRYHVRILDDEGLVTTAKINGKRRYFIDTDTPASREDSQAVEAAALECHAALRDPAKRDVLETLADLGQAHNGRLADALDRDPSTVSHHLSSLADDELVVRERDGRSIVNELAPTVEAILDGENADDVSSPTSADD